MSSSSFHADDLDRGLTGARMEQAHTRGSSMRVEGGDTSHVGGMTYDQWRDAYKSSTYSSSLRPPSPEAGFPDLKEQQQQQQQQQPKQKEQWQKQKPPVIITAVGARIGGEETSPYNGTTMSSGSFARDTEPNAGGVGVGRRPVYSQGSGLLMSTSKQERQRMQNFV